MAGLPAENARLTPGLFARAADRAHLSSQLVRSPLSQLKDVLLPVVVLLRDEHACVLLGFNEDRSQARVAYPELGDAPVDVPLAKLEADYLGSSIYARPTQRFDARTPQVRIGRHDHWFWGVIAESRPLYVVQCRGLSNLQALLGIECFDLALDVIQHVTQKS